jgi:outer membrane protein
MFRPHHLIVLLALVMMASSPRVPAQGKTLTLEQALQAAYQNNILIGQEQNALEVRQASHLSSTGSYLPSVSARGGWTRSQTDRSGETVQSIGGSPITFPPSFSVTNSFQAGMDASLLLFDGLGREGAHGRTAAQLAAAEKSLQRTLQSVTYRVQTSYINVLRTEQLVKVSEENLRRDQRQLERITESNRVGALSLADVYRQQSQVASDELDVITATNNFLKARADLIALVGLDAREEYVLAEGGILQDTAAVAPGTGELAALVQRALAARPDYRAIAEDQADAAASAVMAARSGYFPNVSAFAGYGLSNDELSRLSDNKNISWGLSLRWNLFDQFRTNEALQSATAEQRNADLTRLQTERDITVEVKKSLLDLDASRKALEVSQKALVSAREDRRIAEERYNLGAGTLLDLLVANAGLVNAEATMVNASYGYIMSLRGFEFALGERTY